MSEFRSSRRRQATTALAALALAALVAAGVPAAGAATPPPGAVRVSSTAASAKARAVTVLAASATWVVYALDGTVHARRVAGGRTVTIADANAENAPSLAGGFLVYPTRDLQRTRYLDLDTGASGAAKDQWSSGSPDGGVYGAVSSKDGTVHGYDQAATSGAVTDLGALPGMRKGQYVNALADATGVVFLQQLADGTEKVDYVSFGNPGHAVALRTDGLGFADCTSLSTDALGCVQAADDAILRVPLDGSAPQKIAITYPKKPRNVDEVDATAFVTPSHTFWAFSFNENDEYRGDAPTAPLHSVPASSPHAKPASSSFRLVSPDQVVAGGDTVYVARGGRPSTAGVYALSSANGTQTRIVAAGARPLLANRVAITAGQAVFVDDSGPGGAAELRATPLTRTGGSLTTGAVRTIGRTALRAARASDSRVLYQPTSTSVAVASTVGSGAAHARYTRKNAQLLALSGTRAIVRDTRGRHHDLLIDLVSKRVTDLTDRFGIRGDASQLALAGRYLAFGTSGGSVERLDLTTARTARLAGPTKASRGKRVADIAAWGDYVAWDYFVKRDVNSEPISYTYSSHLRNARTMSKAVTLPAHDTVSGASADGVALRTVSAATQSTLIRPWTGGATRTAVDRPASVDSSIVLYGVNARGQSAGTVYAAPLRHAANRPRSLGNPFGAATVKRTGSWHFDLPTSAVLTSCHVVLRTAKGVAVRTLPCAAALMRVGEAAVTWDGKNGAGRAVAKGRYRWTVTASNADGALLSATGSRAATTGTVTIG